MLDLTQILTDNPKFKQFEAQLKAMVATVEATNEMVAILAYMAREKDPAGWAEAVKALELNR